MVHESPHELLFISCPYVLIDRTRQTRQTPPLSFYLQLQIIGQRAVRCDLGLGRRISHSTFLFLIESFL